MGDYDYDANSSPFLQSVTPPSSSSSDEISLLLNQILYSSSQNGGRGSGTVTTAGFLSAPEDESRRISGCGLISGNVGVNLSSSSLGVCENEVNDDHDCESEEGIEAVVEEGPSKVASRSKRSRAAEVHNLSEKRRRSRINEKMKALQNLIPNSNKTDKASMLDEAIEYLKQLQLQVQMLTMKNGLSLHPMCLPGSLQPFQFSQMRSTFGEDNRSLHVNTAAAALTVNQQGPTQSPYNVHSQCTTTNHLQVASVINPGASFELDSAIPQLSSFLARTSSEDLCREDILPNHQLNVNPSETDSALLPFTTQDSDLKDSGSLEACIMARSQPESMQVKNLDHNRISTSPTFNWFVNEKKSPR